MSFLSIQVLLQQGFGLRRRRNKETSELNTEEEPAAQRPRLEENNREEFMEIINETMTESKSRKTRTVDFDILFKAAPSVATSVNEEMTNNIKALYSRLFNESEEPPTQLLVQVFPPNFNDEPFTIPLRPFEQNNADAVSEAILQANEKYSAGLELFDGKSHIRILAVWPLSIAEGLIIIDVVTYNG